jgi:predicted transcriptional regulator
VQISLDEKLLRRLDRDPEAKKAGRSAVIRRALEFYFELRRRREIDAAYDRAYGGKGDEVYRDLEGVLGGQVWPDE